MSIFEFEGDLDLGLVLSIGDARDLDAELLDLDPVDVLGCLFGVIDRVVDRVFERLAARAREGDFLEYYSATCYHALHW